VFDSASNFLDQSAVGSVVLLLVGLLCSGCL